jgi:hypothetical protein
MIAGYRMRSSHLTGSTSRNTVLFADRWAAIMERSQVELATGSIEAAGRIEWLTGTNRCDARARASPQAR